MYIKLLMMIFSYPFLSQLQRLRTELFVRLLKMCDTRKWKGTECKVVQIQDLIKNEICFE